MSHAVASIDEHSALDNAPIVSAPLAGIDSNRSDSGDAADKRQASRRYYF
jgi:hypothetical protein